MKRTRDIAFVLTTVAAVSLIAACQSAKEEEQLLQNAVCPEGFVETTNIGMGDEIICCPYGTTGQDGYCVDTPMDYQPAPSEYPQTDTIVDTGFALQPDQSETQAPSEEQTKPTEPAEFDARTTPAEPAESAFAPAQVTQVAGEFVYLTAPNGKGSAYCQKRANSLAWNGIQYKCCGYGLTSTVVPSRDDSICCPVGSTSARWVGTAGFDYQCCPVGTVETQNEGSGDKYICCQKGMVGKDGVCRTKTELQKEGKVLMTAIGNKGQAYCPQNANSLAWNAVEFQCCGKGMKAALIPSRGDSICCPESSDEARWVGQKWNDFECCPAGTVETKNEGEGGKYICCPKASRALNGECLSVQ